MVVIEKFVAQIFTLCYTTLMVNEPVNPHDAFFKQYLGIAQVAADFLRHHLPAPVAAQLDLTSLQLEKDTFVDEQLRNHFSDLVYRTVTTAQTPVAIALLFEHKSYPDEWVDFQLLRYQTNLWQQEFQQIQAEYAAAKAEGNARSPKPRTLTPILPPVGLSWAGRLENPVALCPSLNGVRGSSFTVGPGTHPLCAGLRAALYQPDHHE